MMEPPTTEQLAVAARDNLRKHSNLARTIERPATDLAASLKQRLPDIPEEHIAAVLLHTAYFLPNAYHRLRLAGEGDCRAAATVFDIAASAGERMHTAAWLRQTSTSTTEGS